MTTPVTANLIALGGLIAFCAWRARPATQTIRWRNAVLLQAARAEDFTWVPPHFPADFKVEHRPAPEEFREIVRSLGAAPNRSDWANALTLAAHLVEHVEDTGPIQADLITTYRGIRDGAGYCADFVRVFLGLAHACGLTARQWAFSFDGFGGHGHTVVEVFDRQRGKWLLIDVLNNFHAVDAATGEPLGALEYRDSLLGRRGAAVMRRNGPGRLGFIHDHKAIEYYQRGSNQWYLWWGNAVFSYDAHPLVRAAGRISRTLAHVAATVARVQPRIRIYETSDNAADVRRMFKLRRTLVVVGALAALLCVTLAVQLLPGTATPAVNR
jgi:hypothetical protein